MKQDYIRLASLALFMLLTGIGCTEQKPTTLHAPVPSHAPPGDTGEEENIAEPLTYKPGDTIAGWTLISIEPFIPQLPIRDGNVRAKFEGETTISGMWTYRRNDMMSRDEVCFYLKEPTEIAKIPLEKTVFCFSNFEKAKELLGPEFGEGEATVVIQDFHLFSAPTEGLSDAVLTEVLSHTLTTTGR